MTDFCDYCDQPAAERIEIMEGPKSRRHGTGRFIRACEGHKETAQVQALSFVSSTGGNLADDFEKEAKRQRKQGRRRKRLAA